jgi:hypothetical protein
MHNEGDLLVRGFNLLFNVLCPFSQSHSPKTFQEVVLMLFYPILAAAPLEKLTNIGIVCEYSMR